MLRVFSLLSFCVAAIGLASASQFAAAHCQETRAAGDSQQDAPTADSASQEEGQSEDDPVALPGIAEKTATMERREGFFVSYWDAAAGKLYLEVPLGGREFLYVNGLATGLGSNPVGLDRGQLGDQRVVQFRRVGRKVLLVQKNLRFRAQSENPTEQRAVAQSFAESILWGSEAVAEDDDRYLIDLESLLLSDVHGVVETLARTNQGDFELDGDRSAIHIERWQAFPHNVEFEATLTFSSRKPGPLVRQTAPTAEAVTLRQHHSLVALPETGYRPRQYDPRAASMSIAFADYASPLDQPLEQRWILRHRLEKKDPTSEISEAVKPIVYYVDPGAPVAIREALIEGASWWNEAFEAAGFRDAFQVRVLPEDADPMDVRFNMIQWVHRSTRGWSYGGSVIDPRTGEILKGHVTLGSLRVRQDRLLMESLLDPDADAVDGDGNRLGACGAAPTMPGGSPNFLALDPVAIALARIRQLSAHEVGHTLGFVHNFAASTYDDRASVMDYPAPRIRVDAAGQLDFSDAYAVGIGSWDKVAVRYAYTPFADAAAERSGLSAILNEADQAEMAFVTDADSRPAHAAHPLGNLWDNGPDPLAGWREVWAVRNWALENFDRTRLPAGVNSADVEQYLVPVYLYHRYQLQAVGKLIGGVNYRYGPAADPQTVAQPVAVDQQLAAVNVVWGLLQPESLRLPPDLAPQVGVKPYSQWRDQEQFTGQTGRVFDSDAPARVAIAIGLDELLQPERLARWSIQHAASDYPLVWMLRETVEATWQNVDEQTSPQRRLSQLVRQTLFDRLARLADHPAATVAVRSAAVSAIESHEDWLSSSTRADEEAFRQLLRRRLWQFRNRMENPREPSESPTVPPGSPIGGR